MDKIIRVLKSIFSLLPHSGGILNYYVRFYAMRLSYPFLSKKKGFSIILLTYNRSAFLKHAIEAVVSTTGSPYELIVWDNASTDNTADIVKAAMEKNKDANINYHRSKFNYGTNAYALAFLLTKYDHVIDMDDDILALQKGWDKKAEQCFRDFSDLGFLALDVIQDRYTNGAKHEAEKYRIVNKGNSTIQLDGPVGGWFAITSRSIYFRSGGFVFRPDKPFRLEDANYIRKIESRGYKSAILYGVYAYHASGPLWAVFGKYQKIWKEKYQVDHKSFLGLTDNVDADDIPDFSVPERAMQVVKN